MARKSERRKGGQEGIKAGRIMGLTLSDCVQVVDITLSRVLNMLDDTLRRLLFCRRTSTCARLRLKREETVWHKCSGHLNLCKRSGGLQSSKSPLMSFVRSLM